MANESKHFIKNSFISGISLGITFLIVSSFLYLNPGFLHIHLISYIFGAVLGVIGFFGMLIELGKLDEKFREGINNIGMALFFGVIIYVIYHFFSNLIVNIIVLLLSMFFLYAFISGVIQIINLIVVEKTTKQTIIKSSVFVLNLLIFALTILQILQILRII